MSEPNKENARLRAELAEYRKLFDKYDGGAEGLALHISTNEHLRAENTALREDKERLREMVLVAHCPNCDGRGWYPEAGHDAYGEPTQVQTQCEWCAHRRALEETKP